MGRPPTSSYYSGSLQKEEGSPSDRNKGRILKKRKVTRQISPSSEDDSREISGATLSSPRRLRSSVMVSQSRNEKVAPVSSSERAPLPPSPEYRPPDRSVATSSPFVKSGKKSLLVTKEIPRKQNTDPKNIEDRLTRARVLTLEENVMALEREIDERISQFTALKTRLRKEVMLYRETNPNSNCMELNNYGSHAHNMSPSSVLRDSIQLDSNLNVSSAAVTETAEDTEGIRNNNKRTKQKPKKRNARAKMVEPVQVWQNPPDIFRASSKDRPVKEPYNEVVKRTKQRAIQFTKKTPVASTSKTNQISKDGNKTVAKRRRPPRTAVVTLTCLDGEYLLAMKKARSNVSPTMLGIDDLRVKSAATGAMAFEIRGEDSVSKANKLADALRKTFVDNNNVRIARPVKLAEMRIRDLEISITAEEIALAVASA